MSTSSLTIDYNLKVIVFFKLLLWIIMSYTTSCRFYRRMLTIKCNYDASVDCELCLG